MTSFLQHITPERLERTVRVLCPLIEERVRAAAGAFWKEYDLRKEMVACILGSQVRYEMAIAALSRIEGAGLLEDKWWKVPMDKAIEPRFFEALSKGYRFPRTRAAQLAGARVALVLRPLSERLAAYTDARQLRQCLISEVPGLGPKQASMFLRNIGMSHELAILDTHLLRYLKMRLLLGNEIVRVSSLPSYERTERVAVLYAESLGYPVGYLDWAIWATMRAAQELRT